MTTYADIRKRFHRALSRALNRLRPQQSAVSERKPTRAPIAPAIDHGLLTVIVPTYDVAEYLGVALETVLAQSYSNMEILIVDDGSEDQTVTVAEAYAARDPRIRLLAQDHGGQGRARNLAIGSAQGTFITFLDADDELPNRAYEQLIESLIRSGSDFCIGAVERFTSARVWRPAWSREVHARTREFVTIDEFPTAMKDIMACNRMYRRSFWDAQVGTFGEGTAYEDHVPMLRSFFNDAHFDVLTTITYRWRTRDDGSNTGQQKGHLSNLTDRIEVKHQAWTALTNGSDVVKRAWLARVIDIDFGSYYVAARDADDTYRRHLADGVRYFWERLDPVSLSLVRPRSKLSAWLIAQGDWNGLERLVDSFGNDSGMNKQFLVDGAVGLSRERIAHVIGRQPDADLCLSTAFESRAFAQIRHLSWQDDRTLDIDGLLNLGFVDLTSLTPSADLIWSSEGRDVHRVKLTFDPVLAVAQERTGTSRPAPVPFSASIPFATIPGLARGILDSRIDLHVAGLSTSTTVIKPAVSRSPKAQPSTSIDTADGQLLLTPRIGGSRFTIDARSRRPRFTIVSAVYNVARYLDDFIRSVEAQTFDLSQVEIIMVDDGSTDHSLEVLREWQTRRPELITVLTQENQGQGAARNAGLRVATGHWVTFPDPDDTLDHTYFQDIDTFIEQNPSCILVATNRILHFEESNSFKDTHPLRHHFARGDRLFDLDEFSDRFHGSAPCAVFLLDQVHAGQNEFDSRIRPNFEDGHFVTCYLLAAPSRLTGFLASAKYYYRKRADQSSTLQNSLSNAGRYTDVPEYGYLDVLRRAQGIYGHVPGWLQNYMLYELSWYFSAEDRGSGSETAAQGAVAERFHVLLKEIRSFIDDQAIRTYTSSRFLPLWRDALLHAYAKGPWHSSYLVRQEVDERQGLMRLTYRYVGDMPRELIIYRGKFIEPMYAKTQVHRFFDSPMVKERILVVSARGKVSIQLDGVTMEIRDRWTGSSDYQPNGIRTHKDARIAPASRTQRAKDRWVLRVSRSRLATRLFANAWVLMDRIHDSDDSAEILFRYLRKNRPEINAWFVVQRGTPDWKRLKADGYKRIIGYGTPLWLLLLAHAEHMISSHADKPVVSPPAFLRIFEPKWRFTFLQHGVIKDDLSKWLNPKPIDLFITSTVAEHASIAGDGSPYRFTARETKLTELPRFDRLRKAAKSVSAEHQNLILVTPTWRNWLLPPLKTGSQRREPLRDILNSEYVQQWDALLRSEALRVAAEKHNLTIAFMPHPNLQGLQHIMGLPAYIQPLTYTGANVQRLFARAAVLVTDYSSIAFNAAYMDRPVVYFQFDSERVFRGGHVGSAGYFSYEDDGFGPVTYDLDSAERAIHATLEFGKTPQTQYATRIDNAFVYRDGKACQRVTQQILSLNSPVPVRKTWVRHPSPVAPGSGHPDDEASVGRHVDPHVQRSDSEIERNLFGDR